MTKLITFLKQRKYQQFRPVFQIIESKSSKYLLFVNFEVDGSFYAFIKSFKQFISTEM